MRGTLSEVLDHFQKNEPRGEFVIVVGGYEEDTVQERMEKKDKRE